MIAPFVGITLPTVAPIPAWTSGIAATWLWMIGNRAKGRVVLEFLANQAAVDTVAVFSGEQRGDSLIGTFTGVT